MSWLADSHVFPAAFYEEKNIWEELGLYYYGSSNKDVS